MFTEDNTYVFYQGWLPYPESFEVVAFMGRKRLCGCVFTEDNKYVFTEDGCILQSLLNSWQLRAETAYKAESWGEDFRRKL